MKQSAVKTYFLFTKEFDKYFIPFSIIMLKYSVALNCISDYFCFGESCHACVFISDKFIHFLYNGSETLKEGVTGPWPRPPGSMLSRTSWR